MWRLGCQPAVASTVPINRRPGMEAQPATYWVDDHSAWHHAGRGLVLATPCRDHTWKVCMKGSRRMALEPIYLLRRGAQFSCTPPAPAPGQWEQTQSRPLPHMLDGKRERGCVYEHDMQRSREPMWGERSQGPGLRAGVGDGGPPK